MRKARLLKGWKLYLALTLFSYPLVFAITWMDLRWRPRQTHLSMEAIAMIAAVSTVLVVVWACAGSSRRGRFH